MLDGVPAENFRCAVFLCIRGSKHAMGNQDNSNYHGHLFLLVPWKVSKAVFPWAAFLNPTMEKPIESFSMVRIPIFVHGNLDNQKYHGQIAGKAPWKNSKSRFPWSEFPKLPMEFLKMRISMAASGNTVQKWPRNAPLYGRNKKIRGKYASKLPQNA